MPEEKPHDVIIIGAGPAGLTAAIYTGRALLPGSKRPSREVS